MSRFGRDTIEALETVRLLKELKVRINFDQEDIDTVSEDSELQLTIYKSLLKLIMSSAVKISNWGTGTERWMEHQNSIIENVMAMIMIKTVC